MADGLAPGCSAHRLTWSSTRTRCRGEFKAAICRSTRIFTPGRQTPCRVSGPSARTAAAEESVLPCELLRSAAVAGGPVLGDTPTIADIGCGSGTVLSVLRQRGSGRRRSASTCPSRRSPRCGRGLWTIHRSRSRWDRSRARARRRVVRSRICTPTLEHLFPDFAAGSPRSPGAETRRALWRAFRSKSAPTSSPARSAWRSSRRISTCSQLHDPGPARSAQQTSARGHARDQPIDIGVPRRAWKRFVKDRILRTFVAVEPAAVSRRRRQRVRRPQAMTVEPCTQPSNPWPFHGAISHQPSPY